MSIQNPVPKLYKSIIDDVIGNCKDVLLDDGLDDHLLRELQHLWEQKLNHSKAVDNMVQEPEHIISTQFAIAQQQAQQQAAKIAAAAFVLQNNALYQQSFMTQNFQPSSGTAPFHNPQQLYQHFHNVLANNNNNLLNNISAQTNVNNPNSSLQPQNNAIKSNQSHQTQHSGNIASNMQPKPKSTEKIIYQLDGKYDDEEDDIVVGYGNNNVLGSGSSQQGMYKKSGSLHINTPAQNLHKPAANPVGRPKGSTKKAGPLGIKREAGGDNDSTNKRKGPKKSRLQMTAEGDSGHNFNSSNSGNPSTSDNYPAGKLNKKEGWEQDEDSPFGMDKRGGPDSMMTTGDHFEDDDENDNDEISVGGLDEHDLMVGDHLGDSNNSELEDDLNKESPLALSSSLEEPLNSGDDVSEEDPSELFDTDNVIVCQFEKITRSRNKWKFYFKDGIMNVNGKDFVFQRALGEAEW